MKVLNIATGIHGRVLVREAEDPSAIVVGFHGYMENAAIQMDRLEALPGAGRWTLISIQGLHRFYRGRSEDVVAGWMTRQDREAMIDDNIEYADRAIEATAPVDVPLITTGFSQGVAMAFRSGVRGRRRANGIVAVGGDVPPELLEDSQAGFPSMLLTRGERDDWYTAAKLGADVAALKRCATPPWVQTLTYAGAHEWTAEVAAPASEFISALITRRG